MAETVGYLHYHRAGDAIISNGYVDQGSMAAIESRTLTLNSPEVLIRSELRLSIAIKQSSKAAA
jgi:hypothetical protein